MSEYTFSRAGDKGKRKQFYIRLTSTKPTSWASDDVATLLLSMTRLGIIANKSFKTTFEPAEQSDHEDGAKHNETFKFALEATHLNNTPDNINHILETFDNQDVDIMAYDEDNDELEWYQDIPFWVNEEYLAGSTDKLMIKSEKEVPDKDLIRTKAEITAS
jgi:hypothetical protein